MPSAAAAPRRSTQPLLLVLIAASAGIVADRVLNLSCAASFAAAALLGLAWHRTWRRGADQRATLWLLAMLAAAFAAWHHLCWNSFSADDLGRFAPTESTPVAIEAILLEEPTRLAAPPDNPLRTIPTGDLCRLDIRPYAVRDGDAWQPTSGRATLLVSGHLLGRHAGDRVRIHGLLGRPRAARNPGEFDFALHARADRKLCEVHCENPDCVVLLESASRWSPRRLLGQIRSRGAQLLTRYLDPEHAGLATALLLGERTSAGGEESEAYFLTGTLHILVVSGLHVGILAATLLAVLRWTWLPRRTVLVLSGVLVVFYALITGANPPVVRAATLFVIFYAAQFLGRRVLSYNTLAAAALVVLMLNPADLFRTAPQLSFMAVAVLIWAAERPAAQLDRDPFDRLLAESRPWPVRWLHGFFRTTWQVTLAGALVWLVTLPLVMFRFHLFTPVALLLNPLLAPLVWLALTSGFVVLLCGWWLPPVGYAAGFVCNAALAGMQTLVGGAAELPYSYAWVAGPAAWWVLGIYAFWALAWTFPQLRPSRRWWIAAAAGWTGVGLLAALAPRPPDRLDGTFVAVDHGCAVILQLPTGETLLYDAGRLGEPDTAARAIAATLWTYGITHLDAVVISHADADHYNALPELLRRFSVGVVYVSPQMFQRDAEALALLQTAIHAHGIPVREIWLGDRFQTAGGVRIEVHHPTAQGVDGSDNANSIVLAIEHQGRRLLLPGDLETPGIESVMRDAPYDCDLLLAPHHGSRRSDPPGFAAWSTPQIVVISSGPRHDFAVADNAYRHVGAQVYSTFTHGAIHFTSQPSGLTVETFLTPPRSPVVTRRVSEEQFQPSPIAPR